MKLNRKHQISLYIFTFVFFIITFPFWLGLTRLIIYAVVNSAIVNPNPYLLFGIYIPIIYLVYIFRKQNILRNIWLAFKKIAIKVLILPKNKFVRFVVNVLFIPVWWFIWLYLYNYHDWHEIYFDDESFRYFLVRLFLFAPMFFYTRFLWLKESRERTFYGLFDRLDFHLKQLFDKLKFNLNQILHKLKFNLKEFNSEVFNTTSDAEELKKYAELKDQGIITEKEFQAKKKKLLDL